MSTIFYLVFTTAFAVTVPPEIATDTTWTAAESPYSLDVDTRVDSGVRLTIEPGVMVEFADGVSLTIEGELVARGSESSPITFAAAGERFGSIIFQDGSVDAVFSDIDDYASGSIIEHGIIENGYRAVQLLGASPYLSNTVLRGHEFDTNLTAAGAALYIADGSTARISQCTFSDNEASSPGQGGAVYVDSAQPIFQDNTFENNSSVYGGAFVSFEMWSPIVGNVFVDNAASWEGGGMALVSSSQAVLNNTFTGNSAALDGGGIHVCVTCYPHAYPFIIDNDVYNNTNIMHGAAGVGSAHLRAMFNNNIYDNMSEEGPADFAWHQETEHAPGWVAEPSIAGNWWGSTDPKFIDSTIHDGMDDDEGQLGAVSWEPAAKEPFTGASTRATITSMKYWYSAEDEPMPVFLTLYNPGDTRTVELFVLVQYGKNAPPVPWRGELTYPGAERTDDGWLIELQDNAAWFTEIMAPQFPTSAHGHFTWHVALTDPTTGSQIGDPLSARVDLGEHP